MARPDVDLQDGTLGDHAQACVHGGGGVPFDPDDGQVESRVQFVVGHVSLLETQAHGSDEPGDGNIKEN